MVGGSNKKVQDERCRDHSVRPAIMLEDLVTPTTEFSHIVTVEPWPAEAIAVKLAASDMECQRLKLRFDLIALRSLEAFGQIEKVGDALVFSGRLEADVVQACVATLKPVASAVKASFERRFRRGDDDGAGYGQGETVLDDDDEVDVEVLDQDHIDVGEVIAEEFYMALDAYPRAEDADVVMAEMQGALGQDGSQAQDNPFAKLRRH